MLNFLFIVGTRPEIIKTAPVIIECNNRANINAELLHTGQHKELAEDMLALFALKPDYRLNVMKDNQNLFQLTSRIIEGLSETITSKKYDMVFVQGDTTTAFLGALAAFYAKIPVGHIEAGLRTNNRYSPFPEEINRRLVAPLASMHFAPTKRAKQMLIAENIPESKILISGNTVIDALTTCLNKQYTPTNELEEIFNSKDKIILITMHRRENFGSPHQEVFKAISELISQHNDIRIVFPVHPNPRVRKEVHKSLGNHKRIHLINPLTYLDFINTMKHSFLILSDSGGIQEEAPTLKKPVLILRESTERPEGITTGALKLVGTNKTKILEEVNSLLTNKEAYKKMTCQPNPYGDGKASIKIINFSERLLSENK